MKITGLTRVQLCQGLRQIGREDHTQLILQAERDLDAAFEVEGPVGMDIDWRPPLTRLRELEVEGRGLLQEYVRLQLADFRPTSLKP